MTFDDTHMRLERSNRSRAASEVEPDADRNDDKQVRPVAARRASCRRLFAAAHRVALSFCTQSRGYCLNFPSGQARFQAPSIFASGAPPQNVFEKREVKHRPIETSGLSMLLAAGANDVDQSDANANTVLTIYFPDRSCAEVRVRWHCCGDVDNLVSDR